MTLCNIILLEDNKAHRNGLAEDLTEECKHIVKAFRDRKTFADACKDGSISKSFEPGLPIVIIMDIMMAIDLDPKAPFAPRLSARPDGSSIPEEKYCDDNLGITIARDIRDDKYAGLKKNTPILFFTARQMKHVTDKIKSKEMQPALYLAKAAWIDQVQEKIELLLKKAAPLEGKGSDAEQ